MDELKKIRILKFKNLGLGLFVHFGLYSYIGKGEWYMHNKNVDVKEYKKVMAKFNVRKNCFEDMINLAKRIGAKYIVLTTRHHDGFSLYNTKNLTDYDVMHTPTKRDLVKEFVDACRQNDIVPFFYHTLIDWSNPVFETDFKEYLKYLKSSITLLCKNYGEIGGFWFDGTWYPKKLNWKLNEIFKIIRKYQPLATISNNGGLENPGEILDEEIDCIVYEKGQEKNKNSNSSLAKEVCQTLNNHWGYYKLDGNYKSATDILKEYNFCKKFSYNYLINVGPMPNLKIRKKDKLVLDEFATLNKKYNK